MKTENNMNSRQDECCESNKPDWGNYKNCSAVCWKKTIKRIVIFLLIFLLAFIAGFILEPSRLRTLWLVITGTMTVFSGISVFLAFNRIGLLEEE